VIAFGNGNNDRLMLKTAKVGGAVCLNEGCAVDAVVSVNILAASTVDALDLLLNHCKFSYHPKSGKLVFSILFCRNLSVCSIPLAIYKNTSCLYSAGKSSASGKR